MDLLIINKDKTEKLKELSIIDAYEVKDKKMKRLIYVPLNNKKSLNKFYIETNVLKVNNVNIESNYITVELDEESLNIFNDLDEHLI